MTVPYGVHCFPDGLTTTDDRPVMLESTLLRRPAQQATTRFRQQEHATAPVTTACESNKDHHSPEPTVSPANSNDLIERTGESLPNRPRCIPMMLPIDRRNTRSGPTGHSRAHATVTRTNEVTNLWNDANTCSDLDRSLPAGQLQWGLARSPVLRRTEWYKLT